MQSVTTLQNALASALQHRKPADLVRMSRGIDLSVREKSSIENYDALHRAAAVTSIRFIVSLKTLCRRFHK